MTIIIPPEITAQAQADPAVMAALQQEIEREKTRHSFHQEDRRKIGPHIPDFQWRTPEQLLDDARKAVADKARWEASHYGRFVRAEQSAERLVQEIVSELAGCTAARSRAGQAVDPAVMARVYRLRALADELATDTALMELMGPAAMANRTVVIRPDALAVADLIDALPGGRG